MIKSEFMLVAIACLFTIALVSMSYLDSKEVVSTSDQVTIEADSESVVKEEKTEKLGKVIIEDENSDYITWLSMNQIYNNPYVLNECNNEKGVLKKLKKVIIEDENSDYITWLSTQQLSKTDKTYI